MKIKVLIIDRIYNRSKGIFDDASDLEFIPVSPEENEIIAALSKHDVSALIPASNAYTDKLNRAIPRGGLIARYGVGHDSIDKAAASSMGQFVTTTPGVLDNSVAELAVHLMGALSRGIPAAHYTTLEGGWSKPTGVELKDKTLLILGCGRIGKRVAEIAYYGFRMHVIGYTRSPRDVLEMRDKHGFSNIVTSIDATLAEADFISIHLPASDQTKDLINAEFISKTKPGAFLINTSRGNIVDENALHDGLKSGRLGGAALDVFKTEPYQPQNKNKDLRQLDNTILTPHLGSSTKEASDRMAESVIRNIRTWIRKDYGQLDLINKEVLGKG